jgi:lipoprotein LpqH
VVCATNEGKFSIAIGDMITGVIVGLEQDASVVHNAGLGTVDGIVLSFTEGAPGNSATATKNGNTYKITGTATGTDNSGANQVSKTFEVDATCP